MTLTDHFSIGHILAPNSLQPSLRGPRDVAVNAITETKMTTQTLPQRVLAALQKNSPQSNAELQKSTGLTAQALSNAMTALKKTGEIITGPNHHYGVRGTKFADAAPTVKTTRAPQAVAKPPPQPRTTATFADRLAASAEMPTVAAMNSARTIDPLADSARIRVVRMLDGGVLLLDGIFICAELTAAQVAAIKAL